MQRNPAIYALAGLLLGAASIIGLTGTVIPQRALAQAQQPPVGPRYQIAAWAYPARSIQSSDSSNQPSHGAYILDTQSGKVWQVIEGGKPEPIGDAR